MILFSLLCLALIWGQLSTHFFFKSWMSFLGVICCAIGLVRGRVPVRRIGSIFFSKISENVFFALLLFAGFYIFYYRLECGKNHLEVLVYFISTTVRLLYVLPRISTEIDEVWRAVNEPDPRDRS